MTGDNGILGTSTLLRPGRHPSILPLRLGAAHLPVTLTLPRYSVGDAFLPGTHDDINGDENHQRSSNIRPTSLYCRYTGIHCALRGLTTCVAHPLPPHTALTHLPYVRCHHPSMHPRARLDNGRALRDEVPGTQSAHLQGPGWEHGNTTGSALPVIQPAVTCLE